MKNEKGSLLLETALVLPVFFALLFGAARCHRAWSERHRLILEHRNEEIRKIRAEEPELFSPLELLRSLGSRLLDDARGIVGRERD